MSVDEPMPATELLAQLSWLDATGRPRRFRLDGRERATIGRGSRCDLVIRDTRTSRWHATIELVHGQHLLRDMGSANGTYLNGLRLTPGSAFTLRAGDVIEVGCERMSFDAPTPGGTTPLPGPEGIRVALDDLLADGEKALPAERDALELATHRAVSGVSLDGGLASVLALVADRLRVTHAAAFVEDASGRLLARAARPAAGAVGPLHALAMRAVARGEGRLVFVPAARDQADSGEDTHCDDESSRGAVPFGTQRLRGALAVERAGERLDVRALAFLATVGRSVARAIG